MPLVSAADIGSCRYFLPHHCVLKEDISTTKLRIFLNGPAGSLSGNSLNDVLMSGPVTQQKLFYVLLRFRYFPTNLLYHFTLRLTGIPFISKLFKDFSL